MKPRSVDQVPNGERNAVEGTKLTAAHHCRLGSLCRPFESVSGQQRHDGIDLRIDRFNSVEMNLDDLHRGQLFGPDQPGEFRRIYYAYARAATGCGFYALADFHDLPD